MTTTLRDLNTVELDHLSDEAYMIACESDSPNSPGFDSLVERIYDDLCFKAAQLRFI